jgi:hypothetical protein
VKGMISMKGAKYTLNHADAYIATGERLEGHGHNMTSQGSQSWKILVLIAEKPKLPAGHHHDFHNFEGTNDSRRGRCSSIEARIMDSDGQPADHGKA